MKACIHGWLLQSAAIISSGERKVSVCGSPPGISDTSTEWFSDCCGSVCTLCVAGSEFRYSTLPPCCTPTTCGTYRQPFWSITTGGASKGADHAGIPLFTYTKTFASRPSDTTYCSVLFGESLIAQAGSADISILIRSGALPLKCTTPE